MSGLDIITRNCTGKQSGVQGVALMIHKHMLQHIKYMILNNSVEGILWVKLFASKGDFSLSICV